MRELSRTGSREQLAMQTCILRLTHGKRVLCFQARMYRMLLHLKGFMAQLFPWSSPMKDSKLLERPDG